MLAPREIDEYLLPTERRVIRVRQHWAVMMRHLTETALFLLLVVVAQRLLQGNVILDNTDGSLELNLNLLIDDASISGTVAPRAASHGASGSRTVTSRPRTRWMMRSVSTRPPCT